MRFGTSRGTLESFEDTPYGGDTIVFGSEGRSVIGQTLWLSKWAVTAFIVVLCAWLFVYISGLFPYLGRADRGERLGLGSSVQSNASPFGLKRMILFKGQVAFFEYDVRSETGGQIMLDLKPFPDPNFTDGMQKIAGPAQGRAEFVVQETGVYEFYHDFSLNGTGGSTQYGVAWGAR